MINECALRPQFEHHTARELTGAWQCRQCFRPMPRLCDEDRPDTARFSDKDYRTPQATSGTNSRRRAKNASALSRGAKYAAYLTRS